MKRYSSRTVISFLAFLSVAGIVFAQQTGNSRIRTDNTVTTAAAVPAYRTSSTTVPDASFNSVLPPYDLTQPANVTVYSDGAGRLDFEPIPSSTSYYVELKGTTSYKILWFHIEKSGTVHDLKLWVDETKRFDKYYIFKDGPGKYKVTVYGADSLSALSFKGLASFEITATGSAPRSLSKRYLNAEVLAFANLRMGQQVGRGECWDVAQEALDRNGADWVRPTQFGEPLDPRTQEIKPGDIIQFQSVKIYEETPTSTHTEFIGNPDHTAVVYEVLGPLHYRLAHQNIGGKRYIIVTEVNLNNMVSGKMWFYRPLAGLIDPSGLINR